MNKRNRTHHICLLLVISLAFSACRVTIQTADETQETQEVIGMANPAALYCEGMGYALENVERDGGMDADCVFPDGERCSQWDFLAGRCGQAMSFCAMQGGTIQASGNLGICTFADGSTCNELEFFNGDCAMGDNPSSVDQETESEDNETEEAEAEETEAHAIQVTDFNTARDHLMAYFAERYGIQYQDSWMETDITTPNPEAVNTFRYVSGSVTIVLSAGAAAPYVPLYTVQEASDRGNGFYWTGTIALDGTIVENEVILPWSILNPEHARDAALGYLSENYGIYSPANWVDEGYSQAGNTKMSVQFSSGSWLIIVEFEPAAPLVSSYNVTVEDSSSGLRWEGDISGHGEIVQISFVQ